MQSFELPVKIAAFIEAANRGDLPALLKSFAENSLVNDQLVDYWGMESIRRWAERDIIGAHVAMTVVGSVRQYEQVIVTAHMDGDFDKRGLPNPLEVTLYFSVHDERIVQLIILRNLSGT